MTKFYSCIFLIVSFLCVGNRSNAQSPQYAMATATSTNSYPFSSAAGLKTQHLYLPGDLAGAVSGTITRVFFRTATPNATASFTNFYLKLGQTTATQFPGNGLTFATGLTDVVFGATYTVTATTSAGSGDWFYIDLQTPFTFDATQSLILEVVWTTKTAGGFSVRTTTGPAAPNNKRLTSNSPTATTGSASTNWMSFGIELGNPLSAALSNFSATAVKQNTNIVWETANESNVMSYDIQRSKDGAEFQTVGSVHAKGSDVLAAKYEFTDVDAFKAGTNSFYYRLKINEYNKREEYTKVIKVATEEADPAVVSVYPNPFTESIWVNVFSGSATKASLYISDLTGRCLIKKTNDLKKGTNICSVPEANILPAGPYILTVESEGKTSAHQVLKK